MLETFPVMILVGTLLGFLTGLGIGGGSLLMLWLTIILGMPTAEARKINLLFFLPAAAISCIIRFYQGRLKIRPLFPAILSGCVGAAICACLAARLNTGLLEKLYGVLLLITGTREIFYRDKKEAS